jgi:transposase
MGRLNRFNLLHYLLKPRLVREIAEHYGVSHKTVALHLREAVKSGRVLVSEAPVFQAIKDSSGNLKKLKGLVYVCQKSPILVRKNARFAPMKADNSVRGLDGASHLRFLSKPFCVRANLSLEQEPPTLELGENLNRENLMPTAKANRSLVSRMNVSTARVVPLNRQISDRLRLPRQASKGGSTSLSQEERIRLFQALSRGRLPFLDLHECFNVSRQTITRLVKRGFLTEDWGAEGVGVTFGLTGKGKAYLKELERASGHVPRIKETSLTKLKQRSAV